MYICIYVCMYVYMSMYVYMYMYKYMHMYKWMYAFIHVRVNRRMRKNIFSMQSQYPRLISTHGIEIVDGRSSLNGHISKAARTRQT